MRCMYVVYVYICIYVYTCVCSLHMRSSLGHLEPHSMGFLQLLQRFAKLYGIFVKIHNLQEVEYRLHVFLS